MNKYRCILIALSLLQASAGKNAGGDLVNCSMALPVSLKALTLKRPAVMGLIRIGDTVQIECTIQGLLISHPEEK